MLKSGANSHLEHDFKDFGMDRIVESPSLAGPIHTCLDLNESYEKSEVSIPFVSGAYSHKK